MAVSVLIVEDEVNIAQLLQMYLEKEGYAVTVAHDGGQGLAKFRAIKPDLVLLDVMMPVMDGWTVCKNIRAESQVPIIMLTAKGETDDKVAGLRSGADDYVTKPFSPAELTARIDALFRRVDGDKVVSSDVLLQGPFVMNTRNHSVEKHGVRIRLTQVEYAILTLFMQNPGRALSREEIMTAVWGKDFEGELKIVDVNIRRLRIKIEDNTAEPAYITTVWGYGYKWGA